jgi:hypothetical protein
MTIFVCTIVPIEVRNIHVFLSECILSIAIYTNGLLFSSYATASIEGVKWTLPWDASPCEDERGLPSKLPQRITK